MFTPEKIIGSSEVMHRLLEVVTKVAATDANVLILGENGTGKSLVAQAIHKQSGRNNHPFVNVDLGAISSSLFESELFGHTKGAFTDAKEDREGRFETADGGTLFLDEIGNIPVFLQSKLLHVIQSGENIRVGANRAVKVDVRLICATNMPVREMVAEKMFRQDLLYRINTVEIVLPPLRERKDDIWILADYFIDEFNKNYRKNISGIHPLAREKLAAYNWPGNIRELRHAIERAVIMTESDMLQAEDFDLKQTPEWDNTLKLDSYNLEEVEKKVIRKVIGKHGGNISRAAKELGLTRTSLYRRIEKYGL